MKCREARHACSTFTALIGCRAVTSGGTQGNVKVDFVPAGCTVSIFSHAFVHAFMVLSMARHERLN